MKDGHLASSAVARSARRKLCAGTSPGYRIWTSGKPQWQSGGQSLEARSSAGVVRVMGSTRRNGERVRITAAHRPDRPEQSRRGTDAARNDPAALLVGADRVRLSRGKQEA